MKRSLFRIACLHYSCHGSTKYLLSRPALTALSLGLRSKCEFRQVMSLLPQPVVVVTSTMVHPNYGVVKRGVTCSSFTSVSVNPSTVSVSIYEGNSINDVIQKCGFLAANILSDRQIKFGMHFAKGGTTELGYNQFDSVQHDSGVNGVPLLVDTVSTLQCSVQKVDLIADHLVYYGQVVDATIHPDCTVQPMLYYQRSFRSIGDNIFMQAFEETRLPFEEWTHEAHLRMAWNYITQYPPTEATELIRQGIHKLNQKNKERITHGYSETVTLFYIHVITKAALSMPSGHSFEEFLSCHSYLTDNSYLLKFYSRELLDKPESKSAFFEPDVGVLP